MAHICATCYHFIKLCVLVGSCISACASMCAYDCVFNKVSVKSESEQVRDCVCVFTCESVSE